MRTANPSTAPSTSRHDRPVACPRPSAALFDPAALLRIMLLLGSSMLIGVSQPTATIAETPPGFPAIEATLLGDPAPGYIFLSNFAFLPEVDNTPYLMLVDNSGYPVRYRELETPFNLDFKLLPDGRLSYSDAVRFLLLDETLSPIDSVDAGHGYHVDGHELRLLPNGNALILAWDARIADLREFGGRPNAILQDCAIQEVEPEGAVVWEWRTRDHFAVNDATRDIDLTRQYVDYVHCNAIEIDTDGNLLLSSRHFDEITKIDRQTGDIIWRWGGKECANNQFTFVNDFVTSAEDTLFYGFSHQHAIRRLDNGNLLLFDNGNLRQPQFSRAVEYALDEEALTATRVWEYRNTPDVVSTEMGFTQRLPNGNTLIGWGGNTSRVAVTEVAADGTKVFELEYPEEVFSYRACRFVFGMAAVTRDVAASSSIDFNQPDNVTALVMQVDALTGGNSVTVERHEYAAHDPLFATGEMPQVIDPYRWVIRQSGADGIDGLLRFDVTALPELTEPESATLFRRPQEGSGEFESLMTSHAAGDQQLVAEFDGTGEFIIGHGAVISVAGAAPPALLRLEQNRPNPFNRTTTLQYHVAERGHVTLRVFDVSGRLVATQVDDVIDAGSHRIELDAAQLGSGVYFYRLTAGSLVETRKMIAVH